MRQFFRFSFPLLLVAAAILASLSANRASAVSELGDLGAAPAFKFQTLDGRELTADALRGKVVVVDFWATWCPPCIAEIPGYIAMQKKYADAGLVIIGVSFDRKGAAHVRDFVQKRGMNYAIAMGDDEVGELFGGFDALPTTWLIDREGRIRHRKVGAMSHEEYEKLVQPLLQ